MSNGGRAKGMVVYEKIIKGSGSECDAVEVG